MVAAQLDTPDATGTSSSRKREIPRFRCAPLGMTVLSSNDSGSPGTPLRVAPLPPR